MFRGMNEAHQNTPLNLKTKLDKLIAGEPVVPKSMTLEEVLAEQQILWAQEHLFGDEET